MLDWLWHLMVLHDCGRSELEKNRWERISALEFDAPLPLTDEPRPNLLNLSVPDLLINFANKYEPRELPQLVLHCSKSHETLLELSASMLGDEVRKLLFGPQPRSMSVPCRLSGLSHGFDE